MQGFRTYYDPARTMILHKGSIRESKCESEDNVTADNKAR